MENTRPDVALTAFDAIVVAGGQSPMFTFERARSLQAKFLEFYLAGNFVASVWTSVWTPTRVNRIWLRCTACASLEDVSDGHATSLKCSAPLPARPAFW